MYLPLLTFFLYMPCVLEIHKTSSIRFSLSDDLLWLSLKIFIECQQYGRCKRSDNEQ